MWMQYPTRAPAFPLCPSPDLFFRFHLHVWEPEVKVAEAEQAALLLVAGAAAGALRRPGRLGPGPAPAAGLLHPVVL